jgi:hypothetical protein
VTKLGEQLTVVAFAAFVIIAIVGAAFGSGIWWKAASVNLDSDFVTIGRNLAFFFFVVFWWRRRTGSTRTPAGGSRTLDGRMATVLACDPSVHRPDHLHVLPPAEYSRTSASASSRSRRWRSGSRCATSLPGLPGGGRLDFLVCPVCTTKLKQACVNCKQPLEALWQICPYCETRVESPPRSTSATLRDSAATPSGVTRPRRGRGAVVFRVCGLGRDSGAVTAETIGFRACVERTLILIKPDAVQRSLAGEILARIERRGLRGRAGKLLRVSRSSARTHYAEHREKPFFGELVEFITSARPGARRRG